jgi:hypothetical protein
MQRVALPGSLYQLWAEIEEAELFDVPLSADWDGLLPVPEPQIEDSRHVMSSARLIGSPGLGC